MSLHLVDEQIVDGDLLVRFELPSRFNEVLREYIARGKLPPTTEEVLQGYLASRPGNKKLEDTDLYFDFDMEGFLLKKARGTLQQDLGFQGEWPEWEPIQVALLENSQRAQRDLVSGEEWPEWEPIPERLLRNNG
jgi:hypothetical protein